MITFLVVYTLIGILAYILCGGICNPEAIWDAIVWPAWLLIIIAMLFVMRCMFCMNVYIALQKLKEE